MKLPGKVHDDRCGHRMSLGPYDLSLPAACAFLAILAFLCSSRLAAAQTERIEFWSGVTLSAPAGSQRSYSESDGTYALTLPGGASVYVDKWRMERFMWRLSTRQVAAAFRRDQQQAKPFTMRARGNTITTRALFVDVWMYQRMIRVSRSTFVTAETSAPVDGWNSLAAKEARAVVESLKVR